MATLFQDDKGNTSSGRFAFIFSTIFFHIVFAVVAVFLYLNKNLGSNLGGLSILYSTGMGVILTFKVQAKKTENKNEKSNNTTTNS